MLDPFEVLGVSPASSDEEIEHAFREASKKVHPDIEGGDEEAMKRLSWAKAEALKRSRRDHMLIVYRDIARQLIQNQTTEKERQKDSYDVAVKATLFKVSSPLERIRTLLIVLTATAGVLGVLVNPKLGFTNSTPSTATLDASYVELAKDAQAAQDSLIADFNSSSDSPANAPSIDRLVTSEMSTTIEHAQGENLPKEVVDDLQDFTKDFQSDLDKIVARSKPDAYSCAQKASPCLNPIQSSIKSEFAELSSQIAFDRDTQNQKAEEERRDKEITAEAASNTLILLSILIALGIAGAQLYLHFAKSRMRWFEDQLSSRRSLKLVATEFFSVLQNKVWTPDDLEMILQGRLRPDRTAEFIDQVDFNKMRRLIRNYYGRSNFLEMFLAKALELKVVRGLESGEEAENDTYMFNVPIQKSASSDREP